MKFVASAFSFLLFAAVNSNAVTLRGSDFSASRSSDVVAQLPMRKLQQHADGIEDFGPLSCNTNLDTAKCVSWSSTLGTNSVYAQRITIPCGQCITMDRTGTVTFDGGLDIHGKLVFPDKSSIEVVSTMIAVQGELEMSSTKPVDGVPMIHFTMIGNADMTFEPIDDNANNCKGAKTCGIGKKAIVVAGGRVNINGVPSNTPTWVSLYDVAGGTDFEPTSIIVDASVKGKWMKGSEILITSHTRVWDEQQVRKIVGVSDAQSGYVKLDLDAAIIRPTTIRESKDFAVEVALLSRNIVFDAGSDTNEFHGGHFMVFHTPMVIQSIVGVALSNFGQQGNLGRYPIHFHFSGDCPGSKISKNTIRNSNQRCVVVHGTNELEVSENIAFNTLGHCYITEDGMERGNKFIRNLGAKTGIPKNIIPEGATNGEETDDEPATFWLTGPENYFEENVAAGSASAGFWFEPKLRGNRKSDFEGIYDPKFAPLPLFKNNVVHSSGISGSAGLGAVRLYQPGYFPSTKAVMDGLKVYRNDEKGIIIHRNTNMLFIDGLFADNHVGIDLDRATDIEIRNMKIIGESDSYKKLMARQDVANVGRFNQIFGIDLHTWKAEDWGAFHLDNIEFLGFDNVQPAKSKIIHIDDLNEIDNQFEMYTAFSNVKIRDNSQIDFCTIEEAGIDTAYIVDLDGSLSPTSISTTQIGTLLSNGDNMLKFTQSGKCKSMAEGCYTYCSNTCFRSVRFSTMSNGMGGGARLKVCERGNSNRCAFFNGGSRGGERDPRTFIAHLPAGKKYDAVFLNPSGQEVEPEEGDYKFEESFCSSHSQFEVAFKFGPTLTHEVTPGGPANEEPDDQGSNNNDNVFETNWFIALINFIIRFIFGGNAN